MGLLHTLLRRHWRIEHRKFVIKFDAHFVRLSQVA